MNLIRRARDRPALFLRNLAHIITFGRRNQQTSTINGPGPSPLDNADQKGPVLLPAPASESLYERAHLQDTQPRRDRCVG
jgi:hypothetical protein